MTTKKVRMTIAFLVSPALACLFLLGVVLRLSARSLGSGWRGEEK